jgi:quercetin dioxygenase-like cupin family protein
MPFVDTTQLPTGERLPGWRDRTFSTAAMTFAHFNFDAGSKIHEHCHSNEEVWTVIEGQLEVSVGADRLLAGPGCVAIVPPYTAHSVRAVTNGKAIVTDCPVRVDPSSGRRAIIQIRFDDPVPLRIQNPAVTRSHQLEAPSADPINAIVIPFTIHNRGKTSGLVREFKIDLEIAPALPSATTTEIPGGDLPLHSIVEPDERQPGTISYPALTGAELEQLRTRVSLFYVRGVIFYDDQFGCRQHSTFCRIFDPGAFDGQGGFIPPDRPGYNYGT